MLESASKYKEKYGNPSPEKEMTVETRLRLLFFRNDGDQGGEIAELWDREISLEQMVQHLRGRINPHYPQAYQRRKTCLECERRDE